MELVYPLTGDKERREASSCLVDFAVTAFMAFSLENKVALQVDVGRVGPLLLWVRLCEARARCCFQ